jgi:DNA-binding CsgD family transcriptional regulator
MRSAWHRLNPARQTPASHRGSTLNFSAPTSVPWLAVSATSAANILLEREGELAKLEDGMDAAADARGSLILIRGPAGIGKSELLAVASSGARDRDFEVLSARGGEFEQSFGFGIARQLFEAKLSEAGAVERRELLEGAASLAAPAVLVGGGDRGSQPGSMPIGDPAAPIHHGLHWLLANIADKRPVLVSIDDLQWADAGSVRWLVYLARRVSELAVLVGAAVRSGEPGLDPQLLAALEREPATQVLHPRVLSEEASTELVRTELGNDAERDFCRACHRATGGNPFLLRELIAAARADAIPPAAESIARIEELHPETISRSLLLRLASLPEGAEPLSRAVAILGEAEPRHAGSLAELGSDEVASAADALAAAAILAPGHPLRFSHPLIRAAVYAEIPESQRALAHYRAAGILADGGATPEEVAAQLLESEPAGDEAAVEALRRAAADAITRTAPDAAVAYLRRALVEPASAAMRKELLIELIAAAAQSADLSAFEGVSDDPVAELSRDTETLTASGSHLVAWLFFGGRLEEMTDVIERAIAAYAGAGEDGLALRTESLALAVIDIRPEEAVARLESYRDRLAPDSAEQRAWFAMRGYWQHFVGGPASESVALVRQGLAEGLSLEGAEVGPVFAQAILVLLRADQLDEAEPLIDLLLDDARREGGPVYFASGVGLRSSLAFRWGDLRSARADADRAVNLCREHRIPLALAVSLRWLLDVLVETGELAEAEAALVSSGLAGPLPDFWWFASLRFARARLRIAQGRTDEGIADLREMLRQREATRPASDPVASTLALALNSLGGEPDEVERLLDRELDAAHEWGTPRGIGVALRAAGLVEQGDRRTQLLQQAVEALAPSPARLELARALVDLGATLRRANHRRAAREPLREALKIAHPCGATVIEQAAREELAATGAKPRRVMLSGVESLTPSELRVAGMAAQGLENRQIAQELFVSVKTAETHLGHVYRKLDISSRKQLPDALGG